MKLTATLPLFLFFGESEQQILCRLTWIPYLRIYIFTISLGSRCIYWGKKYHRLYLKVTKWENLQSNELFAVSSFVFVCLLRRIQSESSNYSVSTSTAQWEMKPSSLFVSEWFWKMKKSNYRKQVGHHFSKLHNNNNSKLIFGRIKSFTIHSVCQALQ